MRTGPEGQGRFGGGARPFPGRTAPGGPTRSGDGREGWPLGTYGRVIVTAGVRSVPPGWLEQTRPGGVVPAPWGSYDSGQDALVRWTVGEDGYASGPFLRMAEFMKLRDQRLDRNRFSDHVPRSRAARTCPGRPSVPGIRGTASSRRGSSWACASRAAPTSSTGRATGPRGRGSPTWRAGRRARAEFTGDARGGTVHRSGERRCVGRGGTRPDLVDRPGRTRGRALRSDRGPGRPHPPLAGRPGARPAVLPSG